MIKRFLKLSEKRKAELSHWLYVRYVLTPLARKHGRGGMELYVEFTPDAELEAQIEKDTTGPRVH